MPMNVELITVDCLTAADWRTFEALAAAERHGCHPMQHPDFARLLGTVRPDTAMLIIKDGAEHVGFWPVHRRPGRWFRPIGGPFSDVHGPLIRSGVLIDLAGLLSDVNCRGMTVTALKHEMGIAEHALEPRKVFLTNLEQGLDALLADRTQAHPKYFRKHRRLERKLRNEHARVDFVFDDRNEQSLSRLLDMKSNQLRATGRHDVLNSDWARRLIHLLRTGQSEGLYAQLSSLYVDGDLAAAELNLRSGGYLHGWLACYDERFASYSPGHLLVGLILEAMADQGMSIYDAGTEHGHYKKYFSNDSMTVWSGTLRCQGPEYPLSGWPAAMWRTAERFSPGPVKNVMAKVRRRTDQIVSSELTVSGRLKGFARAAIRS